MILVLDNEVDPDLRYLGPELVRSLPDAEYHVYPEDPVAPPVTDLDGIVFSGSTASVYDDGHADWVRRQAELLEECMDRDVPVLGICFGHQLVNHALGGTVRADEFRSGFTELTDVDGTSELLAGLDPVVPVLHGDVVVDPGAGMRRIASSPYSDHFCTCHESKRVWTVQFHPELTPEIAAQIDEFRSETHTFEETNSNVVLDNFAGICSVP